MLSCVSGAGTATTDLSTLDGILTIKKSCFEVVVKKPAETTITYEKDLPWDLVDINYRNDDYESLGTAFAISPTELITANHVLDLQSDSMLYTQRFIRETKIDGAGNKEEFVYELDTIVSVNNHKDYVVFTVKDKVFDSWLPLEMNYALNTRVYTAGNAYGEGIVLRDGMLLDQVPESENGEWNILKCSSLTNPGNSGGPLLTPEGKVIGIVLAKKDDFSYSLPVAEVQRLEGLFHFRGQFGFTLMADKHRVDYDYNLADEGVALPVPYREYIQFHQKKYTAFYERGMNGLFEEYKEETFPNGKESLPALYGSRQTMFPQILLKDSNDKKWFYTNLSPEVVTMDNNGFIRYQQIYKDAGLWFVEIEKPDDMLLQDLYTNPRTAMDYFFKGVRFSRSLYDNDPGTRILSLGDPFETSDFTDTYGRDWKFSHWLQEYNDRVFTLISTPTPKGVIFIFNAYTSSDKVYWEYDHKKIVDFVSITYSGKNEDWVEFFQNRDLIPSVFADYRFSFEEEKQMDISAPAFDIRFDESLFRISKKDILTLNFDFFKFDNTVLWDVRKIIYSEPSSNNYFVSYRFIKPDAELPEAYHNEWEDVVEQRHPFNEKPYIDDDGNTKIGAIHPRFLDHGPLDKNGYAFSIIMSKDGKEDDETMTGYLEKLKMSYDIR